VRRQFGGCCAKLTLTRVYVLRATYGNPAKPRQDCLRLAQRTQSRPSDGALHTETSERERRGSLLDEPPPPVDVPIGTQDETEMAGDDIERIEAVFGAISKIAAGEDIDPQLVDARCPKCGKSNFARVSDLYSEAVGRIEENPANANAVHVGGMTSLRIVERLKPPRRKSAAGRVLLVGIPLGVGAYYVYRRFGDSLGQLAIVVAGVVTVIVLLTSLRRLSDEYYHSRRRWNSLFMCRECGQLVSG
jgi:hypothetical protein